MRRLLSVASLSTLADALAESGQDPDQIWERAEGWRIAPETLALWIADAAEGLASAALNAVSLLELDTIVIDGWMPAAVRRQLAEATRAAFLRQDLSGITAPPAIREGTIGPPARELGGAAIPLSQRFLTDQATIQKAG
jgi:predicted NBD/HSP70 family sugar kinase